MYFSSHGGEDGWMSGQNAEKKKNKEVISKKEVYKLYMIQEVKQKNTRYLQS